MFAVYGPHSWFFHKAKKQFFDQIWCSCNKNKILTILFIVKYEKITLSDEFLVLLGPIISRFLHNQMDKKGAHSSPISMARVFVPGRPFWAHFPSSK